MIEAGRPGPADSEALGRNEAQRQGLVERLAGPGFKADGDAESFSPKSRAAIRNRQMASCRYATNFLARDLLSPAESPR